MSNTRIKKLILVGLMSVVASLSVQAHQIGGNGLGSGIFHPILGTDHLLAMVAVGVISTRLGGKWMWIVPGAFVLSMVLGGMLAIFGFRMPLVEHGIAFSVLSLGLLITLHRKMSLQWAILGIAIFGVFHGHAHGEELPQIAEPALYVMGFVVSTIALHASGILVARNAYHSPTKTTMLRAAGGVMAVFGAMLLMGM